MRNRYSVSLPRDGWTYREAARLDCPKVARLVAKKAARKLGRAVMVVDRKTDFRLYIEAV
jgi:hypothetical protein